MYTIDYLPGSHTLEIAIIGFLSEEDVADFARDLAAKLASIRTSTPPASLYNYTAAAVQPLKVIEAFQAIARRVKPGRRIALYADSAMARQQARRIAGECPTMLTFSTRDDAVAWLQASPAAAVA
jgi:hypothetical protein